MSLVGLLLLRSRRALARTLHTSHPSMDLKIYWGSQTGTAQGFAQELANEASVVGIKSQVTFVNIIMPTL